MTVDAFVFVGVQRVQNVKETLKEFKRTGLVSRKVGGRTHAMGRKTGRRISGL